MALHKWAGILLLLLSVADSLTCYSRLESNARLAAGVVGRVALRRRDGWTPGGAIAVQTRWLTRPVARARSAAARAHCDVIAVPWADHIARARRGVLVAVAAAWREKHSG